MSNDKEESMKKRTLPIISGVLCALMLFAATACDETPQTSKITFNDSEEWLEKGDILPTTALELRTDLVRPSSAAVHDPSVFHDPDSEKYYAFGSHFAVASSENLADWTQVYTDGSSGINGLFGTSDWRSVLSQTDALVGGNQNIWAPDVEYINDTYYMYFCVTSAFGSNKSVIGRVSSDNVTGPYSDEEIIINSTGTSGEPNCIDPELFYDKEGKLWMVYGSFFAGIYIKELNASGENAGLPVNPDEGFGKLLWKGSGRGVEGPFIFYSIETDYYYLMVSDGDLSSNYNMMVARSKNPDGPYLDTAGNDVSTKYGYGNRLAGNYRFTTDGKGYAALGHNSVAKMDGKYFVVHHTRTADEAGNISGGHTLYTTQMYFNEDAWPVLAPNRYCGEEAGTVTMAKATGVYDVVVHNTTLTKNVVDSVRYTFSADGKILQDTAEVGTWSMSQDFYVTATLNNIEYKGVVCPTFSTAQSKWVINFSMNSSTGGALWAQNFAG